MNSKLIGLRDSIRSIPFESVLRVFGSTEMGHFYRLPRDTKVVSKLFESLIDPVMEQFAEDNELELIIGSQNKYPDYSLRGSRIGTRQKWTALDVKSTYFVNRTDVRGLTLGSYQGGLRKPTTKTHTILPYQDYEQHLCLCMLYRRPPIKDERIVCDVEAHLHHKYKIASDTLGSSNTKNIGSVRKVQDLRDGTGVFSTLGQDIFEEYWRAYPKYKGVSMFMESRS